MEKIAFMFLVKSTLLHQKAISKRFFKNKEDKYSIATEINPNLVKGLLKTERIDKTYSWLCSKPESIIKLQDQLVKDKHWTSCENDIFLEYFKKNATYCLNCKDAEHIATKAYTELKKRKGITNDPESWNRLSKKQKKQKKELKELKDAKAEIGKLMAFARDNAKHPRLYSKINKNILADLDEHYFARKFTTDSDIIKWTPL